MKSKDGLLKFVFNHDLKGEISVFVMIHFTSIICLLFLVLPQKLSELCLTTNDNASQYLKQLISFGLKKLGEFFLKLEVCLLNVGFLITGNEIDRISEERASVINQTKELAFQEYPKFIKTAQCTKRLFKMCALLYDPDSKFQMNERILVLFTVSV